MREIKNEKEMNLWKIEFWRLERSTCIILPDSLSNSRLGATSSNVLPDPKMCRWAKVYDFKIPYHPGEYSLGADNP